MDLSDMFKHEEIEGRKYLVYEKRQNDILDTFTMEMLSNNRIKGLASFSCLQMDLSISMKYNITGLISLKDLFENTVNKSTFLNILESLADAVLQAENYMLDLSSYVFDESYIYVNPSEMKVSMIVLPIKREEIQPDVFLKKILFDVRYDQTEDRRYVASLMNVIGNSDTFSMRSFKERVVYFKKEGKTIQNGEQKKTFKGFAQEPFRQELSKYPEINVPPFPGSAYGQEKQTISAVKEHASNTQEKHENLQILFSDSEEDEPKKKKKGFFSKKEKDEKKERKWFFGKRTEKDDFDEASSSPLLKSPLEGIAIPGMDLFGKRQAERKNSEEEDALSYVQRREVSIPAQNVNIVRHRVEQQDFGETVYYGDEGDALTVFEEEGEEPRQRFILYRCSTKESFEIKGDVVRVGRNPAVSEICISGNRGIGRIHAVLYVREGQVYIVDNNSKNKTYVDGEALTPGGAPVMLLSGSKIRFGTEEFEFRIAK